MKLHRIFGCLALSMERSMKAAITISFLLLVCHCAVDDENSSTRIRCIQRIPGVTQAPPCQGRGWCYVFPGAANHVTGSLNGIQSADFLCSNDPGKPSSSSYKAMLVDGVNRIASSTANMGDHQQDWVFYSFTQYRRADGQAAIGTSGPKGLFAFPISLSPIGGTDTVNYWTGMKSDWTTGDTCSAWTSTGGMGTYGSSGGETGSAPQGLVGTGIISNTGGSVSCGSSYRLLCVEQ